MTAGFGTTLAHGFLNVLRGTTYTGLTVVGVKLHIGDPGAAGTANPSAVTTRNQLTLGAPSAGVASLTTLASYAMTTSETITHISLWDSLTVGNFLWSGALTASVPVVNGSTLTFSALTAALSPMSA